MVDLVKELNDRLETMTDEEKLQMYENITHKGFWDRWCEKLHNLTLEQRTHFIEKVKEKYEQQWYIEREYVCGYEPRQELYTLFYEYASRYGEEIEGDGDFLADAYTFDCWNIYLYCGQGSYIELERKDEIERLCRQLNG